MNKETAVAEKVYRDALAVDPQAVETYLALGTFLVQKRLPEAEAQFRQAITLQPGMSDSIFVLPTSMQYRISSAMPRPCIRRRPVLLPKIPTLISPWGPGNTKVCRQSLLTKKAANCPGLPAETKASRTVLVAKCPGRCSVLY